MDTALIAKVRELRKVHEAYGQHTPIARLLDTARRALADDALRARFHTIGEVVEVEYMTRTREIPDDNGADVRLLVMADGDGWEHGLDFDCCTTLSHGRPTYSDGNGTWRKCSCVVNREPEDVTTIRDHTDRCYYGQPCAHKCDEARRIESEGMYGITAQYRDASGVWRDTDAACWGFVGDDWKESGYDIEAMREALESFDAEQTRNYNEQLSLVGAAH